MNTYYTYTLRQRAHARDTHATQHHRVVALRTSAPLCQTIVESTANNCAWMLRAQQFSIVFHSQHTAHSPVPASRSRSSRASVASSIHATCVSCACGCWCLCRVVQITNRFYLWRVLGVWASCVSHSLEFILQSTVRSSFVQCLQTVQIQIISMHVRLPVCVYK